MATWCLEFDLPRGEDRADGTPNNHDGKPIHVLNKEEPSAEEDTAYQDDQTGFSVQPSDDSDGHSNFSFTAGSSRTIAAQHDADFTAFMREFKTLPETQKKLLKFIVEDVNAGKSKLEFNSRTGHVKITNNMKEVEYKARISENTMKMSDVSSANPDKKEKEVSLFCDLIDIIKSQRAPEGVILNRQMMKLASDKRYKEGVNFETIHSILGQGLNATVKITVDTKTGSKQAKKTIEITSFKSNEIRAMFDLSDSEFTPKLHGFIFADREITLFMEELKNYITVNEIILQLGKFQSEVKTVDRYQFALVFLMLTLEAVNFMHSKHWFHLDLHSGNVMVKKEDDCNIRVKLLDFGQAINVEHDRLENVGEYKARINDISCILKQFWCLFMCHSEDTFENIFDFKMYYELKVNEFSEKMPDDIKSNFVNIIREGLEVKTSVDELRFIEFLRSTSIPHASGISNIIKKLQFTEVEACHDIQNYSKSHKTMQTTVSGEMQNLYLI